MTKYMHSLTASRLPSLIPRYRELFVYAHDQRHPIPDQLQSAAADQSQAAVADQPHPPFPWLPLAAPPPRLDGFFPSWPWPFSLGKGKFALLSACQPLASAFLPRRIMEFRVLRVSFFSPM